MSRFTVLLAAALLAGLAVTSAQADGSDEVVAAGYHRRGGGGGGGGSRGPTYSKLGTDGRFLPAKQDKLYYLYRLKLRLDTTAATPYEPIPGPVPGNAPLATVVSTGNVVDISTSAETKVGQFQLQRLVTAIDLSTNVSSTIVNIILELGTNGEDMIAIIGSNARDSDTGAILINAMAPSGGLGRFAGATGIYRALEKFLFPAAPIPVEIALAVPKVDWNF